MLRAGFLMLALPLALSVQAELTAIDDLALEEVIGQSGVIIDRSGEVTFDKIVYTDASGARYELNPGEATPGGEVDTNASVTMKGTTVGLPVMGGNPMDLLGIVFPLTMGEVDIDGDGNADRSAAIFNFKPNLFVPVTTLDVKDTDSTVKINDQVFLTNAGIVILNAPYSTNTFALPDGSTAQYTHPAKLF